MRYRVLGPLVPGSASVQQRLLLSYLLAHANLFVPAHRLVAELWGHDGTRAPTSALRTQVSRLRRRVPAGALVTEPGGYRLVVAPGELDSQVFEELLQEGQVESALALWRGAAFEEFVDRPFLQVEVARLEQLRLQAEERWASTLLSRGDAAAATAAAAALLAEHPDRESARGLLMEALYRSGRHKAALDVYRRWRQELVGSSGLDPMPELSRLERDILRHRMPIAAVIKPIDSFLGRDGELAELRALSRSNRLVTLTGPGGVGKTRLAVETAFAAAEEHPDGATMCELATVKQPDAVARAIGWTVGLTEVGGARLEDQLVAHLRGRRLLLVLDGCEHLLDAVGNIAQELVGRTEEVVILVTSRERLAVAGEHVHPVRPLTDDASLRLFRDRALAANAAVAASDEAVAAVCSRLDGLPLAVELAAARVATLRVEDMMSALDGRFALLADRRRSLAATLQWSYDLLSDREREAFCRLSLFHGPFDRAAAAAVGIDADALFRLAERSLLDGLNPYRMLDSVREYAWERLREQQRLDALARQHADWVLEMVLTATGGLSTGEESVCERRLSLHFAELRAAHQWLRAHEPPRAAELSALLRPWALWRAHGEVFHWAEMLFAETADPIAAACAATGAWQLGDLSRAVTLAANSLPHRAAVETLGEVAFVRGDIREAQHHYRQARQLACEAGDGLQEVWCDASIILADIYAGADPGDRPSALLARATAMGSPSAQAMAYFVIGEARRQTAPLVEAIRLADAVGSRFISGLAGVALAALHASDHPAAALDQYAHVITQWRDTGAWTSQVVTLRTLTILLAQLGAADDAAVLLGADQAASPGAPAFGRDAALLQTVASRLHEGLGAEAFAARQSYGRSLSKDDTVAHALAAIARLRAGALTGAP